MVCRQRTNTHIKLVPQPSSSCACNFCHTRQPHEHTVCMQLTVQQLAIASILSSFQLSLVTCEVIPHVWWQGYYGHHVFVYVCGLWPWEGDRFHVPSQNCNRRQNLKSLFPEVKAWKFDCVQVVYELTAVCHSRKSVSFRCLQAFGTTL